MQDLGHSFSQYGPPCQQITYIYCYCVAMSLVFIFGLQIGGWVTLAIVLTGVTLLVLTHILGKRKGTQYQVASIKWSEARRKSKLARWV